MSSTRRLSSLRGLRVLVTEDDPILALTTAETVQGFGGVVLGPADLGADALALLARARPDAALLGVQLRDRTAVDVAHALRDRHVPFGLVTGSAATVLDAPALRAAPRLATPFGKDALRRLLLELAHPMG